MSDQHKEPSGRTAPPQASETFPFRRKAHASLTQRQARLSTGCPPEQVTTRSPKGSAIPKLQVRALPELTDDSETNLRPTH